jgi:cell division transport system permease protein
MSAQRPDRIMPRWEGAAPLDLVIGVMGFLAALALCASLVAERTAAGWRAGLADGFTVQILPRGSVGSALQSETTSVLAVLHGTKGLSRVKAVSDAEAAALVAPWLGEGTALADLPLPRLVDASIAPGATINLARLAQRLKQAAPDSQLDDHGLWLARLRRTADTVIWSAWAVLALIALATAATVTFATRAGLAAHQDIVSLLHQMGAHAGFIARAFEWHYFVSALIASATGAALAAGVFAAANGLEGAGIEPVPFLPPLGLGAFELAWIVTVPAAVGLIALATARLSVLAALARNY